MAVREHVDAPLRTSEPVMLAERGHEVRAVVQRSFGDHPRVCRNVRMLHADGREVRSPITRMPCRVRIPDELRDSAVSRHLIVGGRLTGLPRVIAALAGQITAIMMQNDLVDLASLAPLGHVRGENEILVSLQILP